MHRALEIPELFDVVANNCKADPSSLISLAGACKRFKEPCIDAFFATITVNLKDLASLPLEYAKGSGTSEIFEEQLDYGEEGLPLDAATWKRFDYYASKIKYLEIPFQKIANGVFFILHSKSQLHGPRVCGRPVLFPRLISLKVRDLVSPDQDGERPCAFALTQFLSPTLVDLYITTGQGGDFREDKYTPEIGLLGPVVSAFCPNLESFSILCAEDENSYPSIYGGSLAKACESFLSGVVDYSHNLKVLRAHVHGLRTATLEKILLLSHLEELDLLSHREDDIFDTSILHGQRLLRLNSLKLHLGCEFIISVLEALDKAKLTNIQLDLTAGLDEVLRKVVERTDLSYTRTLNLTFVNGHIPVHRLSSIRLILDFKGLQNLVLNIWGLFLSDQDMLLFAQSLTQLRLLTISALGPTLLTLAHLSHHCNYLTETHLVYINCTRIPQISTCLGTNKVLKELWLVRSPIEDASAVASFLRKVFPSVRKLVAYSDHEGVEERNIKLWSKVAALIKE